MKEVTAAIIRKEDKVLIARRQQEGPSGGKWEFPGGKFKPGETPEECLARELDEEFAITVKVGSPFMQSGYDYAYGSILLLAYEVEWYDGEIQLRVHDDLRWVKPEELVEYDLLPADIPIARKLAEQVEAREEE